MNVERLVLGQLDTNCWLVSDEAGGPLIVIDPAAEEEKLRRAIAGREVAAIVLTHAHADHLGALHALREAGVPLLVHAADALAVTDAERNLATFLGTEAPVDPPDRVLEDDDIVEAGELALHVIHTPGHTPGGICLFAEDHLFAGDTLFAGSVGRSDLPGGDGRVLASSIAEKLAPLPDDTRVHPGHGPDTTIGRERRINPFFPRA